MVMVALVLVDLVIVSGFPHFCLPLLPLLRLQNLYVLNEHLGIALWLLISLLLFLLIGLLPLLLLFL